MQEFFSHTHLFNSFKSSCRPKVTNTLSIPAPANHVYRRKDNERVYDKFACLSCRLLLCLRGLVATTNNAITVVVVGIARCTAVGAALGGSANPLFIISIVIVVLIHIHLPRGGLVHRGLLWTGRFFLDLSRRRAGLRAIGRRGGTFSHRRQTRAPLVRWHILDGWERRRVVGRLGRVVFFIHAALFFTSSLRRAAALHLPRGWHAVGGRDTTRSLFVKTSTTLLVGNLLNRTGFCFPIPGTLHGRRGAIFALAGSRLCSSNRGAAEEHLRRYRCYRVLVPARSGHGDTAGEDRWSPAKKVAPHGSDGSLTAE